MVLMRSNLRFCFALQVLILGWVLLLVWAEAEARTGSSFAWIGKASPAQRIAQQVVVYVPPAQVQRFARLRVGGILVDKGHGLSIARVGSFSRKIGRYWPTDTPRPLLMVDQEGGSTTRIRDASLYRYEANVKIGARASEAATARVQKQARDYARALKQAGIGVNFAPVVDVATNPSGKVIARLGRSYSAYPEVVSRLGLAFVLESQAGGLVPTLKHFPGQGMVTADSHKVLPRSTSSLFMLQKHLKPYRDILADPRVRQEHLMVMTGHVLYSALDPAAPASLSHSITTKLLRQELGFRGVIITDGLGMKALQGSLENRIWRALRAGADLVLVEAGMQNQLPAALSRIVKRYGSNKALWAQNEASLKRILLMKRGTR
jgi:beta-N-acetylhexosaminidase